MLDTHFHGFNLAILSDSVECSWNIEMILEMLNGCHCEATEQRVMIRNLRALERLDLCQTVFTTAFFRNQILDTLSNMDVYLCYYKLNSLHRDFYTGILNEYHLYPRFQQAFSSYYYIQLTLTKLPEVSIFNPLLDHLYSLQLTQWIEERNILNLTFLEDQEFPRDFLMFIVVLFLTRTTHLEIHDDKQLSLRLTL